MIQVFWVGVIALVASASGQRPSYVDYDYHDVSAVRQGAPAPRSAYASPVVASSRATAQSVQPRPTPVPILKQINRHNDDGSYTYGYEGADGSFKIETKLPTGEVMGKYGYVDDTGKLRVIDYGANKYGFQPAGEGITVAPPTLVDETLKEERKGSFADYDDEPVYAVEQRPQRPQKRPQQAPARSYTGFEQQIRQSPTPSYEELQYVATPAPVRFAPPARRPSPARYAPAPQVQIQQEIQQVPQHIQQQIPQHIQQQIPQHIPQQVPQQIQRQVPQVQRQIPQQIQRQVPQQIQRQIPQGIPQQIPEQFQIQQQLAHIPQPSPVPQRASIPGAAPVRQVYAPAPSPQPRPAPVREAPGPASGSLLDQLIKQYSLPAGVGQPLHDITFGSYSSQTNY